MGGVYCFNNSIFRVEAGEERHAGEGKSADSKARGGSGGLTLNGPHLSDVLFTAKAMDN